MKLYLLAAVLLVSGLAHGQITTTRPCDPHYEMCWITGPTVTELTVSPAVPPKTMSVELACIEHREDGSSSVEPCGADIEIRAQTKTLGMHCLVDGGGFRCQCPAGYEPQGTWVSSLQLLNRESCVRTIKTLYINGHCLGPVRFTEE